jgi:hypothetical protein
MQNARHLTFSFSSLWKRWQGDYDETDMFIMHESAQTSASFPSNLVAEASKVRLASVFRDVVGVRLELYGLVPTKLRRSKSHTTINLPNNSRY